jgi:DNA-binding Xre family transcriptional regulator
MKSNISKMAKRKNIQNPQDLSHQLLISWPTAKNLWDGDITNTRIGTMIKAARFFGCKIDDLLEVQQ